ncbi:MAG: bifunctional phosphopantothenoylcysteine decarboxylase/phosphopantothenate--cysteine ligase CoaBC [Gammaproteobacteria bacterium]|jgi:phosphopantothenoylcysteine decarboxylase/phosphopantothenate--cysteine ligase
MNQLSGKHILLGVTGSIAAYKSAELLRLLRDAGAEVRVVMTQGAGAFITPLTLQALSGHPVYSELLDAGAEAAMGHIELARWADALLVAPASADFIARLAQGRANDLLTAICLASEVPPGVAPAMNRAMWENAATVANIDTLKRRGIHIMGPAEGIQACGEAGPGRLLEPEQLLDALSARFRTGSLAGYRVLVTAGPTREAIDPVRYISNRSSGKMGFAVAAAAAEAGAAVTLVSGPVALQTPQRVTRIDVEDAAAMYAVVLEHAAACDIFIAVAAVADYRPVNAAPCKLKKSAAGLSLELQANPDILAAVAGLPDAPFTVGFAAETDGLESNARHKLVTKGIDMIAANNVAGGQGFDRDDNALQVFWKDGATQLARTAKPRLARQLVEIIARLYAGKCRGTKVVSLNAKDTA